MRNRIAIVPALGLILACGLAMSAQAAAVHVNGQAGGTLAALQAEFPGVRLHEEQNRPRILYGVPMTAGLTPQDAADGFVSQYLAALGASGTDVTSNWTTTAMEGKFTVFSYQQSIDGIPVEYGNLRVLVLNAPVPRVVYAGATMASKPENGLVVGPVDATMAMNSVKAVDAYTNLPIWTEPQLVVFQGAGDWSAPVVTWKFSARSNKPEDMNSKTFFVDTNTGQLVYVRDEVLTVDVNATIQGFGTPGVFADSASNPPALLNLGEWKAGISGGSTAYSDRNGLVTISNSGSTPVTLNSTLQTATNFGGRWVTVVPNDGSTALTASTSVTPPGPGTLTFNTSPSERLTAQVNAAIVATLTHNYFKDRAPSFTGIDRAIPANTGVSGTCNAYFDPSAQNLNFFNSGVSSTSSTTCANTAFSTVISHEYGHFIVDRLGIAQNSFGEGYGDTNAEMIWDDNVTGRGFRTNVTPDYVRDPIAANIQYPCSSAACASLEIHCCGQIVSGVWWRIRTNFGTLLGSSAGLDLARQREVAWSLITTGGPSSSNSAGPSTAIEVLTVDDDNGNINDGTPHFSQICAAFAAHSISCPVLQSIAFSYPSGRPSQVTPNVAASFPVMVSGVSGTPQPGTGTLSYRIGTSGSFTTVSMPQGSPNQYTATLPAASCGQTIQYYVSAQNTSSATTNDPATAPTALYTASATAGATQTSVADLNMNTDPGWTVTNTSVTTGAWERAIPSTPFDPTVEPPSDADGSGYCWVTDNRQGTSIGAYDLDGGPTRLTTAAYDVSAFAAATLTYSRWIYSVNGVVDSMVVEVSSNNGTTWVPLETAAPGTGWKTVTFNIQDFLPLTSQFRVRFSITDNPSDSVTEGGIDAFKIVGLTCPVAAPCYANCDSSTDAPVLTASDFTCFLTKFRNGDAYANCDGSTDAPVLTASDFTCFLSKFRAGCP
jgi:hypothetical protein